MPLRGGRPRALGLLGGRITDDTHRYAPQGASVSASAGVASGTGTANNASASLAPNSGAGSGTGAAGGPSSSVGASGGAASGTGSASGSSTSVAVNAGAASGTGSAYDATVNVTGSTNAPAELASGSGAAAGASASLAPGSGAGAGSGAAGGGSASLAPSGGAGEGSGAAGGPSSSVTPTAGVGSGAGAAGASSPSVAVNAGHAAGTGTAYDATVDITAVTNAPAELASGTGAAHDARISIAPNAGTGTGVAQDRQGKANVAPPAGLASGTGTSYAATVSLTQDQTASAGVASGTGTAYAPSISIVVDGMDLDDPELRRCVRFLLRGVDITHMVVLRQTYLESVAQGQGATSFITVRDVGQEAEEFITGSRVIVDLGSGSPIYQGYVTTVARRFWFDVDDPETMQRQWVLHVADVNILFQKRVTYKQSSPADVKGPTFQDVSYDDQAIASLVDGWLDLSADDIDVVSKVDRVASITEGQPTYPWQGGMTWGQAMATIAMLPAAIWYIDPDRCLVYADVDIEDAPFVLSNVPGAGSRGYREATIDFIGDQLVNDYLALGFGQGQKQGVYRRYEDAASIALHDRWQDARVHFDIYKQATINRVAASTVTGSPSSKRGHKDDRVEIKCVTYADGLRVGQKVRFVNTYHDYDDVIPIRSMRMTFPSPCDVRYELKLSHDYDAEWGLYDKLPYPKTPNIRIPQPIDFDPVLPEEVPCGCGITDAFERSSTQGWGMSDAGLPWTVPNSSDPGNWTFPGTITKHGYSVENGYGSFKPWLSQGSGGADGQPGLFGVIPQGVFEMYATVSSGPTVDEDDLADFQFLVSADDQDEWHGADIYLDQSNSLFWIETSQDGANEPGDVDYLDLDGNDYPVGTLIRFHMRIEGGRVQANVWPAGTTEPGGWMVQGGSTSYSYAPVTIDSFYIFMQNIGAERRIHDLEIVGLDACTNLFDGFTRDVTDALGVSDSGYAWETVGYGGTRGVSNGSAYAQSPAGLIQGHIQGAPEYAGDFVMTSRVKASAIPTGSPANWVSFTVFDSAIGPPEAELEVWLNTNASGTYRGGLRLLGFDYAKTDWVAGAWYWVKWSTVDGAKVWKDGEAEPGWQITEPTDAFSRPTFRLWINADSGRVDVAEIDFSGDSRCRGADCRVLDTFDRVELAGNWGVSSSGYPWVISAPNGQYSLSEADRYSVDGQYGLINLTFETPVAVVNDARGPWAQPYWEMTSRFKTGMFPPVPGERGDIYYATATDYVNGASEISTVVLYIGGLIYGGIGASWQAGTADVAWEVNTWYLLKWEHDGTWNQAKVWKETDPEPDWMVYGNDPSDTATQFWVWGWTNTEPYLHTQDLIQFCTVYTDSGEPGVPESGRVCEDLEVIAGSYVRTSRPMVANSSVVKVNGLTQRLGVDYVETLPTQVVFDDTLVVGIPVEVCYTVDEGASL